MIDKLNEIQELLQKKAHYNARLSLIPYVEIPEVKENKSGKYL